MKPFKKDPKLDEVAARYGLKRERWFFGWFMEFDWMLRRRVLAAQMGFSKVDQPPNEGK